MVSESGGGGDEDSLEGLCESCKDNFRTGTLTDLDIDIAVTLLELEEQNPELKLKEASFYKSIDLGTRVILVVGKGESDLYKKVIKDLQKRLTLPRLEFIEKGKSSGGDFKSQIADFVQPGKLLGVNQVFLPTGDNEYKARVQIKETDKLPMPVQAIEQLIHEYTGKIVRLDLTVVS
jgi:hypothetical protein